MKLKYDLEIVEGVLVIRIPLRKYLRKHRMKMVPEDVKLTKRELEVLRGVVEMKQNKEIADELHIAVRTVKFHVSELLRKHKVSRRMDLRDTVLKEE